MNSLHKYISPEVLPKEYGGTASITCKDVVEKLLQRNEEIEKKLRSHCITLNS